MGVSFCTGAIYYYQTIVEQTKPKQQLPTSDTNKVDQTIVKELLNLNQRNSQLEAQLLNLKQEILERGSHVEQAPRSQTQIQPSGNVYTLVQVIDAAAEASNERVSRALEHQQQKLNHEHLVKLDAELRNAEIRYAPTLNKIKELEHLLRKHEDIQQKEAPARVLWLSCQSLLNKLRFESQVPLENDPAYEVLKKFAAANNQLAISVLETIPPRALKEGVQSEELLIDRFRKIDTICKRVAMVPEHGGGLLKYLVSYMQSLFILEIQKVSEDEINGKTLVDPSKWHTFDILARVKFCLQKHNLEQAVRYANQLRGQARVVARDWIRDARAHLEAKQAFLILSTYAESIGMEALQQSSVEQ